MITASFDLDKNKEFCIPHNSNEQGNNILVQNIMCTQVMKKQSQSWYQWFDVVLTNLASLLHFSSKLLTVVLYTLHCMYQIYGLTPK